jgi:lysozyme
VSPRFDERLRAVTRRWPLTLPVLAGIALALLWSGWLRGWVRFNYPSFAQYPVQGVDVSHHQGAIDWAKLAGPHAQFAWVKASEGADFRDEDFHGNFAGAARAGIVPGAYHYFTLCKPGAAQAANFIAAAGPLAGHGLPPAVDLEYGGNCAHRPPPELFARELRDFLVRVEQAWGCRPVLYVTPDFYPDYVAGRFPTHRLWVRDVLHRPRLPDERVWQVWQYAHRTHLPGVKGFVDRNAFAGTQVQFAQFLCRPPQENR